MNFEYISDQWLVSWISFLIAFSSWLIKFVRESLFSTFLLSIKKIQTVSMHSPPSQQILILQSVKFFLTYTQLNLFEHVDVFTVYFHEDIASDAPPTWSLAKRFSSGRCQTNVVFLIRSMVRQIRRCTRQIGFAWRKSK